MIPFNLAINIFNTAIKRFILPKISHILFYVSAILLTVKLIQSRKHKRMP